MSSLPFFRTLDIRISSLMYHTVVHKLLYYQVLKYKCLLRELYKLLAVAQLQLDFEAVAGIAQYAFYFRLETFLFYFYSKDTCTCMLIYVHFGFSFPILVALVTNSTYIERMAHLFKLKSSYRVQR